MNKNEFERFIEKIDFTIQAPCWIWAACKTKYGYGRFGLKGKTVLAHRFSYEMCKGRIPDGLVLDHLCRNPSCVNPDHLEAVTQRVNSIRGIGWANINIKKTHCKRGHEFTKENTVYKKDGTRRCKFCGNMYNKVKRQNNPEKVRAYYVEMRKNNLEKFREQDRIRAARRKARELAKKQPNPS